LGGNSVGSKAKAVPLHAMEALEERGFDIDEFYIVIVISELF
jgi:hypothetical protein